MDERNEILEQMSAYIDGELSQAQVERVDAAMAADPSLAAEMESLRRTRDVVRQLPRKNAGPDFVANVLAQAERLRLVTPHGPESVERSFQWVRYLATAAVLLVAGGVGIVITAMLATTPSADHADHVAYRPAKSPMADATVASSARKVSAVETPVPAAEITAANSEVMYSSNVDQTVEQVARELSDSGIEPAAISKAPLPQGGDQVRILAYVPMDQTPALRDALRNLSDPACPDKSGQAATNHEQVNKDLVAKAPMTTGGDTTATVQVTERSRVALNTDFRNQTMCGLAGNNTISNGSQVSQNLNRDVPCESNQAVICLEDKKKEAADKELSRGIRQNSSSQLPVQPMVIVINTATPAPASDLALGEKEGGGQSTGGGSGGASSRPAAKPTSGSPVGCTDHGAATAPASQPASQPATQPATAPAK